jgi:hypothetical protein
VQQSELVLVVATQRAQASLKCLPIFSLCLLHLMQLIDNDTKLLLAACHTVGQHEITAHSATATATTTIAVTITTIAAQ